VAIATDGCNVIGQHNFLVQKLKAKIVSLVSVHCHAHRLASASYNTAADLYSMVCETAKHCNTIMTECFTVSPLPSPCLAMHETIIKTQGRRLQRSCKTRWFSSEATVRARGEILFFWAALKHLSENKNDAMCVVLL